MAYTGDETLTTVRLAIDSALPIASIESETTLSTTRRQAGSLSTVPTRAPSTTTCSPFHYAFDGLVPDGEYPVDLTVEEVTGADGSVTAVIAIDGAVIVDTPIPRAT